MLCFDNCTCTNVTQIITLETYPINLGINATKIQEQNPKILYLGVLWIRHYILALGFYNCTNATQVQKCTSITTLVLLHMQTMEMLAGILTDSSRRHLIQKQLYLISFSSLKLKTQAIKTIFRTHECFYLQYIHPQTERKLPCEQLLNFSQTPEPQNTQQAVRNSYLFLPCKQVAQSLKWNRRSQIHGKPR